MANPHPPRTPRPEEVPETDMSEMLRTANNRAIQAERTCAESVEKTTKAARDVRASKRVVWIVGLSALLIALLAVVFSLTSAPDLSGYAKVQDVDSKIATATKPLVKTEDMSEAIEVALTPFVKRSEIPSNEQIAAVVTETIADQLKGFARLTDLYVINDQGEEVLTEQLSQAVDKLIAKTYAELEAKRAAERRRLAPLWKKAAEKELNAAVAKALAETRAAEAATDEGKNLTIINIRPFNGDKPETAVLRH